MIISLNIESENIYCKIFEAVKIAFTKLNTNNVKPKGRPRKYFDEQIVSCMLYGVKNSIFSLIVWSSTIWTPYKMGSVGLFSRWI